MKEALDELFVYASSLDPETPNWGTVLSSRVQHLIRKGAPKEALTPAMLDKLHRRFLEDKGEWVERPGMTQVWDDDIIRAIAPKVSDGPNGTGYVTWADGYGVIALYRGRKLDLYRSQCYKCDQAVWDAYLATAAKEGGFEDIIPPEKRVQ